MAERGVLDERQENGIKKSMKTLLLAFALVLSVVASQADEAKPAKTVKDSQASSCCAAKGPNIRP